MSAPPASEQPTEPESRPSPGRREVVLRWVVVLAFVGALAGLQAWQRAGIASRELPPTPEERAGFVEQRALSAPTIHAEFGWLNLAAWEREPAMRDLMLRWLEQPGELRTNYVGHVLAANWRDDPQAMAGVDAYLADERRRLGDRFLLVGMLGIELEEWGERTGAGPSLPVPGGIPTIGPARTAP